MCGYGVTHFKYKLLKASLIVAILGQGDIVAANSLSQIDSADNPKIIAKGKSARSEVATNSNKRTSVMAATNGNCEMDVKQMRDAIRLGQLLVIDTRSEQDFQQLHIPNALNIPAYAVKAKAFLKNQQFVLVNEGRTTGELHEECLALQKLGFAGAHLLNHGLLAWQADKAPLEGDIGLLRKVGWILPQEFQQEQRGVNWQVVNLSNNVTPDVRAWFPRSQLVPMGSGNDTSSAIQKIRELISQFDTKKQDVRLLVVDEDGAKSEKLEAMMAQEGTKLSGANIYYLSGGVSGYRSFVDKQKNMLRYQAHPPKHPKVCNG
jgi:rhodanese-related sulfurtransferase